MPIDLRDVVIEQDEGIAIEDVPRLKVITTLLQ